MRLSNLKNGEEGIIVKVLGHGAFRKRILEMGFVKGKKVTVLQNAPLKDPIKYKIMDYEVSLRQSEASMIEVITPEEAQEMNGSTVLPDNPDKEMFLHTLAHKQERTINVALVGNPNCGKTSLFNYVSGMHEHVGNYSGVTVDAKKGFFEYNEYRFNIYDLPGTYSLSAYTPEELYVRHHLMNETPDVIINVTVASNLERNLYLTTELIDMDYSMVIALNMYDELEHSGNRLDYEALGKMIGVPIIPTVSKTGRGVDQLFDTVIRVYENQDPTVRHIHVNHGQEIESGITVLKDELKKYPSLKKQFSPRYLAIKLLEKDKEIDLLLKQEPEYAKWISIRDREVARIEKTLGEDIEYAIANAKYGFISGALKETYVSGETEERKTTQIIDSFVTHKLFGFPIFLFLMWIMFEATFKLGSYPMEWIENAVQFLGTQVDRFMHEGMLKDLIIDGILGGVGGVIVFLPNILILYFFISFMEDSGYMARAAFIMDKIMHRIGLHGKSFIPLIMGFGCNVPAIMASRTIESRSSRIITILINPFMSCSARIPVYVLLIGTFFPEHASLVFISLYLFGILMAIVTAKILRKFFFKKDETPFVMELPPYRMPTGKNTLIHMWEKAAQYLRKMGGLILIASIAIWFLSYFPRPTNAIDSFQEEKPVEQTESYISQIGHICEPIVQPLGFNWKISVALLSGTAAKELIVSTLGVLYSESDDNIESLSEKLSSEDPVSGKPDFTPLVAFSFMVFVLLYFPCIASVIAISGETGSWRWGLFSIVYNTALAWITAFVVYQVGLLII